MKTSIKLLILMLFGWMLTFNTTSAAELTVVFDSATPTAPEGTARTDKGKYDSGAGAIKLGSDGNYVEWVLENSTFTAAKFDGYINTTNKEKVWAFQFTTDKGSSWSSELTQPNDGDKTVHTIEVSVEIPAGANGIRIIRRAGTSTMVRSITLTTGQGGEVEPQPVETDATLSSVNVLDVPLKGFAPDKFEYNIQLTTLQLATLAATQNITFTTTNPNATVAWEYTSIDDTKGYVTITVTAEDGVSTQNYVVNVVISDEPALSDDATLAAILVDNVPIDNFKSGTYTYSVNIQNDAKGALSWVVSDPAATADILEELKLSDVKTQYTISVVAENGAEQLYTVTIIRITESEVPETKLACHYPEKYETMTTFGGYGGTLTVRDGREYEVYYLARYKKDNNNVVGVSVSPNASGNSIISTNETPSAFDSKDNWFIGRAANSHSSYEGSGVDEFEGAYIKYKMLNGDYIEIHVSGYDQFRLFAKDNNSNPDKLRYIEVYIDGAIQSQQLSTEPSVRTYDMSAGEHLIRIHAIGSSNNEVYGWSLRLTNNPLVKYVSGNDSTQQVNQTQALKPVKYAIKNFAGSRLSWVGNSAEGVVLTPLNAIGDTMQLEGVVTAPVGTYEYTIEALDANNNVSTSINGKFTVKTELLADTTNATVWINDAMEFPFTYYANSASAIHFTWTGSKPAGLTTAATDDHTYVIKGTPTQDGSFPYSISIDGGNTLTGTIVVDIPSPQLIAPEPNVIHAKAGQRINNIEWKIKFASNATVSGLPEGLSGSYSTGKFVISGVPAAIANYPQTFTYTITATPEYTGKSSVTATGQIIIIDPEAKSLLYLYKDNYNDAVYQYLNGRYDVTARATDEHSRQDYEYDYYNVVVISENVDANNGEVLEIIQTLNKPILNMKSFTYSSSRLNWGNPDNGSVSNLGLKVIQPEHPIFSEYGSSEQFQIPLLTDVDIRGIQPVEVTLKKSLCIAVAPIRDRDYNTEGDNQTAIHEVPGNLRGNGITARYILLPIAQRSAQFINATTRRLIDAIISYLSDNETGYKITLPTLQIISFNVEGVAATIDEASKTITCIVPDGTDLSNVIPAITLADNTTHTIPEQGEAVDLSDSHFGVEFTVSDYINTVTYNVKCRTKTAIENDYLSGVSYDATTGMLINNEGHMLYIYDVMGRLVNMTNTTISLSSMPHGLYLIQSHDAMMKIMK